MIPSLPAEAKVVIVGGGIVGCSIAYHLAELGWKDIVLLEQRELAGGTTWHAAGLVGRLRTTNSMTRINKYSAELYARLERETGHATGWKQTGSLIVGRSAARMTQLYRTAAMSERFGVEVQIISPKEAQEKWPLLRIDDVLGAAWLPDDGKVIPKEVALALAQGARRRGVTIAESVRVTDVRHVRNQVTGLETNVGNIQADYVVLAGGMWTRELGLRCGVTIPLYPVEHHYVITEDLAGARDDLPVGRDPDLGIYFRGEGNAVMLGAFQKHSKAWMVDRIPENFSYQLLEPDWEKFSEPLANGKHRIPALATVGFAKFVNGPESFTPDNNFILGEAPEMRNLFVAAGFNSVGIASAGGAGKCLAEWMEGGQPSMDLWSVDIRRFGSWANNRSFLRERVTEILGLHYQMAWPNREFETGRGIRKSPLHDRLAAAGACFGAKNGWERPNWFASGDVKPVVEYSFGRQNWFHQHAAEHIGTRQNVAVFDQSAFSKYLFRGADVVSILQRLCGNNVDVPIGHAVYSGMFNEKGGFESDLTIIRFGEREYFIVTGTAQGIRDFDWITRHIESSKSAELIDVTTNWAVLGVMGPQSRTLLNRVTNANLSNEAFPFRTSQTLEIGMATVRAVRLTYVGELGWELYIPVEQAACAYDALMSAGADEGVMNAGHYAINSLRLEAGYRAWGAELSPEDTPIEAGLGFAIDWSKPFIGREALMKQKNDGVKRRLVTFVLEDPEPILWGSEPIYRDGKAVGYTSSGSYGHTIGAAIGMGYVNDPTGLTNDAIEYGAYEINVGGRLHRAVPHLRAAYDPQHRRVRM